LKVNEIFCSIQGEGHNTGIAMAFVRLAGCNLRCDFCDTQYALDEPGEEMDERRIIRQIKEYDVQWVCVTGGEPFIQDLSPLTSLLKEEGFKIHIETNGTLLFKDVVFDWLTVSPKCRTKPDLKVLDNASEIKFVVDSAGALQDVDKFERWGMHHYLQPVYNKAEMQDLCVDFIKKNPKWRLSLQMHKLIGIA